MGSNRFNSSIWKTEAGGPELEASLVYEVGKDSQGYQEKPQSRKKKKRYGVLSVAFTPNTPGAVDLCDPVTE